MRRVIPQVAIATMTGYGHAPGARNRVATRGERRDTPDGSLIPPFVCDVYSASTVHLVLSGYSDRRLQVPG